MPSSARYVGKIAIQRDDVGIVPYKNAIITCKYDGFRHPMGQ